MSTNIDDIKVQLESYKKKYYVNRLLKHSILFISVLLVLWLVVDSVEYTLQLNTLGRTLLFFVSMLLLLATLLIMVVKPALQLLKIGNQLTDEHAAVQIGKYFPKLGDKLLNTIQLENNDGNKELIAASIEQRSSELSVFRFSEGINLRDNRKYLKYLLAPTATILVLLLFIPQFITESTTRIINYDKNYLPRHTFEIYATNDYLSAFKNEDFVLKLSVQGEALPSEAFLVANSRKYKLDLQSSGQIEHVFEKVQESFDFSVVAGSYESNNYHLSVKERPGIRELNIQLDYPSYTGLKLETVANTGHLSVPEGTAIDWKVETQATTEFEAIFNNRPTTVSKLSDNLFQLKRKASQSESYSFNLKNEHGVNKDSIAYQLEVIKDQLPVLEAAYVLDTTLFQFVLLSGKVSDDYGLTALNVEYTSQNTTGTIPIPYKTGINNQRFFFQWPIDSLSIGAGEDLEFYVEAWDNDEINGRKNVRSSLFKLRKPTEKEMAESIEKEATGAKKKLDNVLSEAKELNKQIESIQDKLKSKTEADWKDTKSIQDLLRQKKALEDQLEELAEKNQALNEKRENFSQPNEELQQKAEQLQQLMEDILDEETKKLYDELQKLLEENSDSEQIEQLMNQIENQEENLEKELERAIEMFKRMQFDYKMDEIVNDLEQLEKEQLQSAEDTESKKQSYEELQAEQQKHQEQFDEVKEKLEDLEQLNQELKEPESMDKTDQEQEAVDQAMQESMENLQNQKRKKSSDSQKKAGEAVKNMKEKMANMQANMTMEMMTENLQNLRNILENLVKLSFDQEGIMKDFRGVNQSDPRFVTLSQQQLKLKDDAKIIEDSLLALANRVFQIQSFVTRELDEMNDNIEASLQSLRDRHKSQAVSNQQYAMTSINNLALLLDDVLQQMMEQMAEAMGMPQSGQDQKSGEMPQLSQLQKELSKKIQELQKSGKTGRELSQQLAELAAEQESLRKKLQQMQEKLKDGEEGNPGGNLSEAIEKMEETEMDLVNKNISRRTLQRQEEIITRMLEAENALREREQDQERKGEEANKKERNFPPAFEEYLKAKEKELELLHTVPVQMNPYYKEEVNKYFQRLNEQ